MVFNGLFIYCEINELTGDRLPLDGSPRPAIFVKLLSSDAVPASIPNPYNPEGLDYKLVDNLDEILFSGTISQLDFKSDRDCILTYVRGLGGGSMEIGFDMLTEQQQKAVAMLNIGSPDQQAAALPLEERKNAYRSYHKNMMRVRRARMDMITADVFTYSKNKNVIFYQLEIADIAANQIKFNGDLTSILEKGVTHNFDNDTTGIISNFSFADGQTTVIYLSLQDGIEIGMQAKLQYSVPMIMAMMLRISNINPEFAQIEVFGDLRESYISDGLMGLEDDKTTGVLDFFLETPLTRFQPYDSISNKYGGCKTHPYFAGIVPDGFANMSEYADYVASFLKWGDLASQH